jgi:predicted permease
MVWKLFFAGIIAYFLYMAMGYIFTAVLRVPKFLKGTYICMFIFANSAFMGYPVVQALYGDSAIFYITIFNMPFNVFMFTLGTHYFKKDASLEENAPEMPKTSLRQILNNGLLAGIAALLIYFLNIPLPEIFYSCVGFIGSITTPLSMILIGSSLAAVSRQQILTEKGVWPMLPFRLLVIPAIIWLFMHLFTNDPTLIAICAIGAGMPVASLVAMVSSPYPRQHRCADISVSISTICSMVTIPILAVVMQQLS